MDQKYKRMVDAMVRKEKSAGKKRRARREWSVYIARCSDGTLYTGIAKDVARRLKMHNAGTGARYTRSRRPVTVEYTKNSMTRSQALSRECAIKTMSKKDKEALLDLC